MTSIGLNGTPKRMEAPDGRFARDIVNIGSRNSIVMTIASLTERKICNGRVRRYLVVRMLLAHNAA